MGEVPHRAGRVTSPPAQQGDDDEEKKDKHGQDTDDNKHICRHLMVALRDAVPVPVVRPALPIVIIIGRCTAFEHSFAETILVVFIVNIQHCADVILFAESIALCQIVVAHRVVDIVLPKVLTRWRLKRFHELVKRFGGDVVDSVVGGWLVLQQPMSFAREVCCGHVEVVLEVIDDLARCLVVAVETHGRVVGSYGGQGTLPRGDSRGNEHWDDGFAWKKSQCQS